LEAFILIALFVGGAVGGVIMLSGLFIERKKICVMSYEEIQRECENTHRKSTETLEKLREKRRETLEKLREKEKILENQFIDEFPELSLQERVDLSRKLVRVKAEW
jgi:hypothetical protein